MRPVALQRLAYFGDRLHAHCLPTATVMPASASLATCVHHTGWAHRSPQSPCSGRALAASDPVGMLIEPCRWLLTHSSTGGSQRLLTAPPPPAGIIISLWAARWLAISTGRVTLPASQFRPWPLSQYLTIRTSIHTGQGGTIHKGTIRRPHRNSQGGV